MIDVETTGLFAGRWHNRVAEIGVVLVGRDGAVTGEWSTLVNPERDLGPQHVHGISAADVRTAPTFAEIAGDVAGLLKDRVVVAHNLGFDLKFLSYEFERLGYSTPAIDFGLCTMALSQRYLRTASRSLAACCALLGIRQETAHSAVHDARAAAALFGYIIRAAGRPEPWAALLTQDRGWPDLPPGSGRTRRRSAPGRRPRSFLARMVERLPPVPEVPQADEYLAMLDRAMLDRHLSDSEQDALLEVAESVGISFPDAMELHRRYLTALAQVAWQDGQVTETERTDLLRVAALLGLPPEDVDTALDGAVGAPQPQSLGRFRLEPGDLVAFTGQMNGQRAEWERRATTAGLAVTPGGVTRRTRLLVAADPDSLSGKAAKARQYGIPIVTEGAFVKLLEPLGEVQADVLGHVVVCRGADEDGADVIVVWQVNAECISTGAWSAPAADALADPEVARGLLELAIQRAPAGWEAGTATTVLGELARVAGGPSRDWAATAVTVPEVLAEIAAIRADYDKRIAEELQLKKNIVAVEWEVDIPDPLPGTPDSLREHARLAPPVGGPVIRVALLTASLLRWSLLRWQETMSVLGRREYLQRSFGRPRRLPPGWEARLAGVRPG